VLPGSRSASPSPPSTLGRAKVGEDGQDAAVVGFGGGDRELGEDRADVLLDRALAEDERLCDPRVRPPLRHQPEYVERPRGEDAERPTPGDELSHDLGVERGAALGDAAHGVEEVADVPDTLLQEIAHGTV